ncbi:MAG: hypothetical protein ACLQM6_10475 [Acidobacteriaceae bacterium]
MNCFALVEAREWELLPTRYVHLVFTLPRELAPLALQNKRVVCNLLFRISAATLLEIARDPRHLGTEIGFQEPARQLADPLVLPRGNGLARHQL